VHINHILLVTARIDDGEETDDWEVTEHRTGESVPLRADRWFQKDPSADPALSSGDYLLSVLPDKIARFLYEYHDTLYTSLGLPPIPLDRSGISVHSILRPDQVHLYNICITCKICMIYKNM